MTERLDRSDEVRSHHWADQVDRHPSPETLGYLVDPPPVPEFPRLAQLPAHVDLHDVGAGLSALLSSEMPLSESAQQLADEIEQAKAKTYSRRTFRSARKGRGVGVETDPI